MTRPIYPINEWNVLELPGVTLTQADRRLLPSLNGVIVDELRQSLRISTTSFVGLIRFESFDLQIIPKLANGSAGLVDLLMFTHGLGALRRLPNKRDIEADVTMSIFDLLALIFSELCERILQTGLRQDYVEVENDISVLRGRLLLNEQIRRHHGQIDELTCRYDDHLTDIIDNQILRATFDFCRGRVTHPRVRFRINRLHNLFLTMCSPLPCHWHDAQSQVVYHRMNEHYREAHELAWLLLAGAGITDLLATGKTHGFSFLMNMNTLFEAFVERLVMAAIQSTDIKLHRQNQTHSFIWDATRSRDYVSIRPDVLLIHPNGSQLTLDAKYKLYDERRVSTGDIYQNFLYTLSHDNAQSKQPLGMIIHPASGPSSKEVELHVRNRAETLKARLIVLSVPINIAISEVKTGKLGPILTGLRERILDTFSVTSEFSNQ